MINKQLEDDKNIIRNSEIEQNDYSANEIIINLYEKQKKDEDKSRQGF